MKIYGLNGKGFSDSVILIVVVVVFATAGVGYMVAGNAASKYKNYHCTRKVLGLKSSGPCVRLVQSTLGLKPRDVDGIYGPKTAAVVKKYQVGWGLKADGVIGPRTWKKLCRDVTGATGHKGTEYKHFGCGD